MIHGVVAQLMAFVYHARQHIRYLGDTLADHQKRSNRAALLEAVQQIVGQAVRIAVLFAGRTVVKRQRDINIGLRNIAVHGIASLSFMFLRYAFWLSKPSSVTPVNENTPSPRSVYVLPRIAASTCGET